MATSDSTQSRPFTEPEPAAAAVPAFRSSSAPAGSAAARPTAPPTAAARPTGGVSRGPAVMGMIDTQALMAVRSLELRARMVVEGFWHGLHRSPYHGFSVEFTEYRPYTAGDDTRHLDWRVLGRSDRYFIRKYEDETNLRAHLVVDQSRSMAFGSLGWTKAQYAATLAATLGWFLHQQGDAVGLLSFDDRVRDYLPARHRSGHLRQLMLALEKPAGGSSTDVAAPMQRMAELARKRGLIVVISDFLAPLDRLSSSLSLLRAWGHEVEVFQVLDPAEVDFRFSAPAVFEDVESGRTLFLDPEAARDGYGRRLEAHREALRGVCRGLGVGCHFLTTDQPLELSLFSFLQLREARRRGARQVRTSKGGAGS